MLKIDDRDWDLSRSEFADAIAKGLGRAFLYVKNHGDRCCARTIETLWTAAVS
jgi:hypothetical protein